MDVEIGGVAEGDVVVGVAGGEVDLGAVDGEGVDLPGDEAEVVGGVGGGC